MWDIIRSQFLHQFCLRRNSNTSRALVHIGQVPKLLYYLDLRVPFNSYVVINSNLLPINTLSLTLLALDRKETPKEAVKLPNLIAVNTSSTSNGDNKNSLPSLAPRKPSAKPKKQTQKKAAPKESTPAAKNATAPIGITPMINPSSNGNDHSWTGRIVGLRLPPSVDSNFDEKCKPFDRRVDLSPFLAKGTDEEEEGGGPAKKKMRVDGWTNNEAFRNMPFNAQSTEGMSISLGIHLTNENDPSGKPVKLHMIRDPNEDVPKTLQRLQLSVQKKVGGKKKKQKKKKGNTADAGAKQDEAVLWRKKPKVEIIPAVEPALLEEDPLVVEDAPTFWDGIYDAFVPINVCKPWSDMQGTSAHEEQQLATVGSKQHDLELHESVSGYVNDSILMEGYERVNYADSLTINEVLYRAATLADDLGRYALSVPVVTSNKNSSATSWIPLELESCPPTITSVSTFGSFKETHLFERTPIVVEVGVLYATKTRISWFAGLEEVCADSPCYTPTSADVGKVLTVVIVPQRLDHDGVKCEEAYQFQRRVEALPALPNVTPLREEFLDRPRRHRAPDGGGDDDDDTNLRVVTYNILADQNASRDVEKGDDEVRMYSHCKNEHIVKWRRHPLIVHEILEYRPDVIALQEVDTDVFEGLLKPVLTAQGYEGYFSQKGVDPSSGVREGCAIFWSLEVFESVRPVDMKIHSLRDMIQQFSCEERMHKRQWKSLSDMADLLDKHYRLSSPNSARKSLRRRVLPSSAPASSYLSSHTRSHRYLTGLCLNFALCMLYAHVIA